VSLPREQVEAALGDALDGPVHIEKTRPVGGGCISSAARLGTSRGTWFVKWNASPLPEMFSREAEALCAMRASGTSLAIPEPVAWQDAAGGEPGFLVTSWLEPGRRQAGFEEALGRGLAELHRAGAERFGFDHDNYCGATTQPNGWLGRWPDFYRERRLGHQLRLAVDAGRVSRGERRHYERLLGRLDDLVGGDGERPALIHGDLWGGNLHVASDGSPAIIDPAAYYAHREAEAGMMLLFGGFGPRVFDAYEEAWPLPAGWRERVPLYTLYHLMNHLNLFGGGYGAQALSVVRRFV